MMKESGKCHEVRGMEYEFPPNTVGYLIGKPENIKTYKPEDGCHLEPVDIKPGDTLYVWYRDPSEYDDDFDWFDVYPEEGVYAIKSRQIK